MEVCRCVGCWNRVQFSGRQSHASTVGYTRITPFQLLQIRSRQEGGRKFRDWHKLIFTDRCDRFPAPLCDMEKPLSPSQPSDRNYSPALSSPQCRSHRGRASNLGKQEGRPGQKALHRAAQPHLLLSGDQSCGSSGCYPPGPLHKAPRCSRAFSRTQGPLGTSSAAFVWKCGQNDLHCTS